MTTIGSSLGAVGSLWESQLGGDLSLHGTCHSTLGSKYSLCCRWGTAVALAGLLPRLLVVPQHPLYISLDSAFEQHLWSLWIVFVSRVLHASVAMVAVFQPNYLGKMLGFSHVEPEPKRVVYDRPDGPSSPFSSVCKNGPRTWSWRSKWTTRQLEKGHVIHTLKSGEQSTKLTNVSGEENLICESCPKKQRHSLQSMCPWLSSVFFLCSDLYSFSLGLRRPAWGAVLSMMGMRRFTCS